MEIAKLAVFFSTTILISNAAVAQQALKPQQRQSQQDQKLFKPMSLKTILSLK